MRVFYYDKNVMQRFMCCESFNFVMLRGQNLESKNMIRMKNFGLYFLVKKMYWMKNLNDREKKASNVSHMQILGFL